MRYYPLNLRIEGRKTVVVGGGKVAERKVKGLLAFGAQVWIVSPDLTPDLRRLAGEGRIRYRQGRYEPDDLAGAFLVFAATSDRGVNSRVAKEAQRMGAMVNVADSPAECTFILPAILQRERVLIAVSSDGRSPSLSRRVRDRLAELWDEIQGAIGQHASDGEVRRK